MFFGGKIPVRQRCGSYQTNSQQNFQDQTQIFFHGYSKRFLKRNPVQGGFSPKMLSVLSV
jgi:hypothetical protein